MRRSRHICRKLFERFPEIRNQLWKGELWNHSYYVETVGSVSEEKDVYKRQHIYRFNDYGFSDHTGGR